MNERIIDNADNIYILEDMCAEFFNIKIRWPQKITRQSSGYIGKSVELAVSANKLSDTKKYDPSLKVGLNITIANFVRSNAQSYWGINYWITNLKSGLVSPTGVLITQDDVDSKVKHHTLTKYVDNAIYTDRKVKMSIKDLIDEASDYLDEFIEFPDDADQLDDLFNEIYYILNN